VSREILLMHNAEKPGDDTDPGLSPEGEARARTLARDTGIPAQHRPISTIRPLSRDETLDGMTG